MRTDFSPRDPIPTAWMRRGPAVQRTAQGVRGRNPPESRRIHLEIPPNPTRAATDRGDRVLPPQPVGSLTTIRPQEPSGFLPGGSSTTRWWPETVVLPMWMPEMQGPSQHRQYAPRLLQKKEKPTDGGRTHPPSVSGKTLPHPRLRYSTSRVPGDGFRTPFGGKSRTEAGSGTDPPGFSSDCDVGCQKRSSVSTGNPDWAPVFPSISVSPRPAACIAFQKHQIRPPKITTNATASTT